MPAISNLGSLRRAAIVNFDHAIAVAVILAREQRRVGTGRQRGRDAGLVNTGRSQVRRGHFRGPGWNRPQLANWLASLTGNRKTVEPSEGLFPQKTSINPCPCDCACPNPQNP